MTPLGGRALSSDLLLCKGKPGPAQEASPARGEAAGFLCRTGAAGFRPTCSPRGLARERESGSVSRCPLRACLPSHKYMPRADRCLGFSWGKPHALDVTCHRSGRVGGDLTSETRLKFRSSEMQKSWVWPFSVELHLLVIVRGGLVSILYVDMLLNSSF